MQEQKAKGRQKDRTGKNAAGFLRMPYNLFSECFLGLNAHFKAHLLAMRT
jgi:hypothetical protein